MHNITFISTIHNEIGKCNPDRLFKIIDKINPEVIFLEAVDDTYSEYDKYLFSTYVVYHKKLELAAIQKYSHKTSFYYVPVCDRGLSDSFDKKYEIATKNIELQKLIENFTYLAYHHGFKFLNSEKCIILQDEMRRLESKILNNNELDEKVNKDIEKYEMPMFRNIYEYCENNKFRSAIFMCGAAHRKSIIEKIEEFQKNEKTKISWNIYGT